MVGPAARASGVDVDLRRDPPHDGYEHLRFDVPVEEGGDVRARLMVRAREVEQSLSIVRQALAALAALPSGPLAAELPAQLPSHAAAFGWVESWRGACTHLVATGERGEVTRVKVTDASSLNWPGIVQSVPGNIVPDFPVINKSFNFSYSGNDR
jgi:Ni,Fe-hydrogenase III large subunit